jgi:(1->4)-alpha-D-glucan 1-alpha-D-glucosylmutase
MREAKVFTSWLNPSEPHEQAMARFVEAVLAPDNTAFRSDFLAFQSRVAQYGIYNSLAQLAIKITAPGVPDFYQGTELWDLTLVDPDNRRPVDYERRRALLEALDAEVSASDRGTVASRLSADIRHDRLKLYSTSTLLRFRREHQALFESGGYTPLTFEGARREHLFGFARVHEGHAALAIVPRLVATLLPDVDAVPLGERAWTDTRIMLPVSSLNDLRPHFENVMTGGCAAVHREDGRAFLRAADVFENFPIALLHD